MRGSLSIRRRVILRPKVAEGDTLRALATSLATGVIAGLLVAHVRLNLGLPGHKALLWMPPIIVARLRSRCRIGATAGSTATSCTTFALGGHLAGGSLGLPLLVVAGVLLDLVAGVLESRKVPAWLQVPALGGAAMFANLVCLAKRLFLPAGFGARWLFDASGFWFQFWSYALFGLTAGLIAGIGSIVIGRRRHIAR